MPIVDGNSDEKLLKKFEKIDEDWRDRVSAQSVDELRATLVEVTKNEALNQETKEQDTDLASCKEAYDTAVGPYKDGTAMNKLKIKYALRCLKAKGG